MPIMWNFISSLCPVVLGDDSKAVEIRSTSHNRGEIAHLTELVIDVKSRAVRCVYKRAERRKEGSFTRLLI